MLVFWKERLVFLAVPKTGTTAIEGALAPRAALVIRDPPILKHTPAYRYHRFLAPYLKLAGDVPLETLGVIRAPEDWLASWYRYRHRDDLLGHANSTRGMSFETFVGEYIKDRPAGFANVGGQAKFLGNRDGACTITHLFRYEDQARLIGFLEERLAVRLNLKRLNVSPQTDTTLSAVMRARLYEKCAVEYALWERAGRG